uniref:Uncharacterized protein n=1 Tax=Anguilla anguilla TaxID=7936 RepID=A0A0E9TWY0_ANGAN
MTPHTCSVFH